MLAYPVKVAILAQTTLYHFQKAVLLWHRRLVYPYTHNITNYRKQKYTHNITTRNENTHTNLFMYRGNDVFHKTQCQFYDLRELKDLTTLINILLLFYKK